MSVSAALDRMIGDLIRRKTPPEYIIMGTRRCAQWLVEISRDKSLVLEKRKKRFRFSYQDIPIVVCESDILEVVPNARFLLGADE